MDFDADEFITHYVLGHEDHSVRSDLLKRDIAKTYIEFIELMIILPRMMSSVKDALHTGALSVNEIVTELTPDDTHFDLLTTINSATINIIFVMMSTSLARGILAENKGSISRFNFLVDILLMWQMKSIEQEQKTASPS